MEPLDLNAARRATCRALKGMRLQAGLTQEELAERLGVSRTTVDRMEGGKRRCDVIELIDWCEACGADAIVTFERLLDQFLQ